MDVGHMLKMTVGEIKPALRSTRRTARGTSSPKMAQHEHRSQRVRFISVVIRRFYASYKGRT